MKFVTSVTLLSLLVVQSILLKEKEGSSEAIDALDGLLENSVEFSISDVIIPRVKEWFIHKFDPGFSTIINGSKIFVKLAEYVVESERPFSFDALYVYSPKQNVTSVEFEPSYSYRRPKRMRLQGIEVKFSLLYRASEHDFLERKFHLHCDGYGPTITLVKAENGRIAAFYNGVDCGLSFWCLFWGYHNPRGFIASIYEDRESDGGYSLQKFAANKNAYVLLHPSAAWGPDFGPSLYISDRCNLNSHSYSYLSHDGGYGREGEDPCLLFGSNHFRVLDYEVFQIKLQVC
jgi:hypothetical protein